MKPLPKPAVTLKVLRTYQDQPLRHPGWGEDGEGQRNLSDPKGPRRPYRQLLGVRGESSHFPKCLCPPKDKGQVGPLAGDTGDVHTLQGVEVDLPYLDGRRQPAIPARDRSHWQL